MLPPFFFAETLDMSTLVTIDDIVAAERAIAGRVLRTPAVLSPALSDLLSCRIS